MAVESFVRMNGGEGETSYAKNSYIQSKAMSITKSIKQEAIRKMYMSIGRNSNNIIAIADLGCGSAPDGVWSVIYTLIKPIHDIHTNQQQQQQQSPAPDYIFYLNDLPGNDFNTVFNSVPSFQHRLKTQIKDFNGQCFIYGVPGSFYNRLFKPQSLHFVHSSYSVHWLSRVPEGIEKCNTEGSIYISRTSLGSVVEAYYGQFRSDFTDFLECRGKEVVDGGWMVLTLVGRRGEERGSKEGCCRIWEMLAMALNQMVSEGLIEKAKMDSFNLPIYHPSAKEIQDGVEDQGSFTIDRLDVSEIDWEPEPCFDTVSRHNELKRRRDNGNERQIDIVRCMRSVVEPILVDHFGEGVMEETFMRYNRIVSDEMRKEKCFFVNITVSLCKNNCGGRSLWSNES